MVDTVCCVTIIYRTQNLRYLHHWRCEGNYFLFNMISIIEIESCSAALWSFLNLYIISMIRETEPKGRDNSMHFLSSQLRFPTFKREARRNPLIQLLSTRMSIQLGLVPTLSSPKQPHQTLRTIKHPLWMSDRFFNSQVVHIRVRYKDSPAHQWLTK